MTITSDLDRRLNILGGVFHAAGGVGVALMVVLFQFGAASQLREEQWQVHERSQQLASELDGAASIRQEYERLTGVLRGLEERAATVRQRIPDQPYDAEFLDQIAQVASQAGLDVRDYSRGGVVAVETHSEIDVQLSGNGTYTCICSFLAKLSELPRVSKVRWLTITNNPDGSGIYPIDMNVVLYFGATERTQES